jgi:hypothetical protein
MATKKKKAKKRAKKKTVRRASLRDLEKAVKSHKFSPDTRLKMSNAQRARWAKFHGIA